MRHLRKGRRLGRSASHRKALFRNMASSLLLTERHSDVNESGYLYADYLAVNTPATGNNPPKVSGRIVTTLPKAKELRPYVEKCVTIAKNALKHLREAEQYATKAKPDTDEYREWRKSEQWQKWNAAIAPAVYARRRVLQLIGDKQAVRVLFEEVAERFQDRPGGYTRIVRLAKPRLGDAGERAILEFVGIRDRVQAKAQAPSFESDEPQGEPVAAGEGASEG